MAIRAAGQNIEVTWSHSGRNEKSNTISETTAVILRNVSKQFSNAFVSNCINFWRSSSCDMWLECDFWWHDEAAKENFLMCDIVSCHEPDCSSNVLIFPEPSRKPSTSLLHLCTLFFFSQMRCLSGYLSSNVSIWAGFSQSHSAVFGGYECLSQRNAAEWSETERRLLLKGH